MKNTWKILAILLITASLVACATPAWPAERNTVDFWKVHGIWFLVFMALFPRITMILATAHPIGCLSWIGWLIAPRILAAIIATHYYWETNTALVVVTWLVALSGTGASGSKSASYARRRY